LIQRFGSAGEAQGRFAEGKKPLESSRQARALNLNIHFHMLFLDGVYTSGKNGTYVRFRRIKAPTAKELTQLTHTIARRIAHFLERQGLLEQDSEGAWLTSSAGSEEDQDAIHHLLGSSITYRIAVGPQQGRKVFTLQTLPDCESDNSSPATVGKTAGFSLHAGVATQANEREKLERLCRYITRPAVSANRMSLTRNGQLRYELKTPWRNGTTHIIFEPLDFIARLVSLVPRPRVNLTRFHGVFAPNSHYRVLVTPAGRGKGKKATAPEQSKTPAEHRVAMTWAKRLKRVFKIDIDTCSKCGGSVKVIACIEDPAVIKKILLHLDKIACLQTIAHLPESRAPPQLV
jgi:hypothetical protein